MSHVAEIGASAFQASPERITTEAGTTVAIDAAYVGAAHPSVLVQCTSSSAVTVTLANDVPIGKVVSLRQAGAGVVRVAAGTGATLQRPPSAAHSTADRYDLIVYQVVANANGTSAVWGLIRSIVAGTEQAGGWPDLIAWPSDANFIDITAAPYNADPTGTVDCTQAIRDAIVATSPVEFQPGTVYFPAGTYLVSDTINPTTPMAGVRLLGAGKTKTTILLAPNSPGFTSGNKPVWKGGWIHTGANFSYGNYVQHLTIQIGSGNGNAVAFEGNIANSGATEHIRLIGPGGRGFSIDGATGNAYAHDIEIEGFTHGVWGSNNPANDYVCEDFTIRNCTNAISNQWRNLQFLDLTVENCPTVLDAAHVMGAVLIINGTFTGGSGGPAITMVGNGWVHLRNISASGWDHLVQIGATNHFVGRTSIAEWSNKSYFVGQTETAWSEALTEPVSFNLPIKKPPEYHTNDFTKWANVQDFGAIPDATDRTAEIQAAIDSGAEIVYFPHSRTAYTINGTLRVRGDCRKVDFMFSLVSGSGAISIESGTAPEVLMENWAAIGGPPVTKATTRPVSLRNGRAQAMPFRTSAGGEMFVTNFGPHTDLEVGPGVSLWTRQLDRSATHDLLADNATCWCYGDNVEGNLPLKPIRGTNGAIIEVLGGTADCRDDVHPVSEGAYFQSVDSYMCFVMTGHLATVGEPPITGSWEYLLEDAFGANTYQLFDDKTFFMNVGTMFTRIAFPLYISPHWPPA